LDTDHPLNWGPFSTPKHNRALAQAGVRDLGINTETLVDGLMELVKAGAATGSRPQVDVGKRVYAFAIGSRELHECIDPFCLGHHHAVVQQSISGIRCRSKNTLNDVAQLHRLV